MTSHTSTARVAKLRAERKADGCKELRGIWVPVKHEPAIKALVSAYLSKQKRQSDMVRK